LSGLLEWSKLQMDNAAHRPEKVNIQSLLSATTEIIRPLADQKNVSLIMDVSRKTQVFADRNMLASVLQNLLTNAVKFSPEGGQVKLQVSESDKSTLISVSDTGQGMDKSVISTLFSHGSKAVFKGADKESGSGLGLLICREIIEKHGGKITASSAPGEGTCITVTLPKEAKMKSGIKKLKPDSDKLSAA
jgi:two-component system, sensor histidine kinase and response regulator